MRAVISTFLTLQIVPWLLGGCAGSGILHRDPSLAIPGMKRFVVTSDPAGAKIFFNGEPVGETPGKFQWMPLFLPADRTTIELRKEDHIDTRVILNLASADPVVSRSGGLTVRRSPGPLSDAFEVHARLRPTDLKAYEAARRQNTTAAYQRFVADYPDSLLADGAKARVAEGEFEKAVEQDSVEAYRAFLQDVTRSGASPVLQREAQRRLEEAGFVAAKKVDTIAAHRQFVSEFPGSRDAPAARERIRQITEEADRRLAAAALLLLQGKTPEAVAAYKEAIRLRPDNPEALFQLATLYQREQKVELAYQSVQEAVRLDPGNEAYRALAERLRREVGGR